MYENLPNEIKELIVNDLLYSSKIQETKCKLIYMMSMDTYCRSMYIPFIKILNTYYKIDSRDILFPKYDLAYYDAFVHDKLVNNKKYRKILGKYSLEYNYQINAIKYCNSDFVSNIKLLSGTLKTSEKSIDLMELNIDQSKSKDEINYLYLDGDGLSDESTFIFVGNEVFDMNLKKYKLDLKILHKINDEYYLADKNCRLNYCLLKIDFNTPSTDTINNGFVNPYFIGGVVANNHSSYDLPFKIDERILKFRKEKHNYKLVGFNNHTLFFEDYSNCKFKKMININNYFDKFKKFEEFDDHDISSLIKNDDAHDDSEEYQRIHNQSVNNYKNLLSKDIKKNDMKCDQEKYEIEIEKILKNKEKEMAKLKGVKHKTETDPFAIPGYRSYGYKDLYSKF